jgi:hypothetical protein
MPELLDPAQAAKTTVALPGPAAVPVQQGQPQQAAAPANPFRVKPGPKILILPHSPDAAPQAAQQGREGRPARLARADILPLYHGAWENVRDAARWGILADALDEDGAPAWADLFRRMAPRVGEGAGLRSGPQAGPHPIRLYDTGAYGVAPTVHGVVRGLPITMWALSHGGQTDRPEGEPQAWGMYVHRPDQAHRARDWSNPKLWVLTDPDHGRRLLGELEGDLFPDPGQGRDRTERSVAEAKAHFGAAPPARLARDRNTSDIQPLLAALQANPQDRGLRGVLADAMDEAGRAHEAMALRSEDPIHVHPPHLNNPDYRLDRWYNGAVYSAATPQGVMDAIDSAYRRGARIHVSLGDQDTGRDWLDEFGAHGTIGHSSGRLRTPLLIANSRSRGGFPLLTDSIVRIRQLPSHGLIGRDLYRHPSYHHGTVDIRPLTPPIESEPGRLLTHGVFVSGDNHANFTSERGANLWVRKMGLSPATARPPEPRPEQFAAAAAPKGGMLVRGIMYRGGERVPEEAVTPQPAPQAPAPAPRPHGRLKKRLRDVARRPSKQSRGR